MVRGSVNGSEICIRMSKINKNVFRILNWSQSLICTCNIMLVLLFRINVKTIKPKQKVLFQSGRGSVIVLYVSKGSMFLKKNHHSSEYPVHRPSVGFYICTSRMKSLFLFATHPIRCSNIQILLEPSELVPGFSARVLWGGTASLSRRQFNFIPRSIQREEPESKHHAVSGTMLRTRWGREES